MIWLNRLALAGCLTRLSRAHGNEKLLASTSWQISINYQVDLFSVIGVSATCWLIAISEAQQQQRQTNSMGIDEEACRDGEREREDF